VWPWSPISAIAELLWPFALASPVNLLIYKGSANVRKVM